MALPQESAQDLSRTHTVVFFDGVCGLCNTVVDWILARDQKAHFRFAPLQGSTAATVLGEDERKDLHTVVVIKNGQLLKRSAAIVEVLLELGGPWPLLARALKLVPLPLRDIGYKAVARVRYRVWGKRDFCRLPTKEERARFLD